MNISTVEVSMRDDNSLDCSYAVITKAEIRIIIILRESECAIFDYDLLKSSQAQSHYLLLKHYANDDQAYTDFLKLIGKMCKKAPDSKYFRCRKDEDNRMVRNADNEEHMITECERGIYEERFEHFCAFVIRNRMAF